MKLEEIEAIYHQDYTPRISNDQIEYLLSEFRRLKEGIKKHIYENTISYIELDGSISKSTCRKLNDLKKLLEDVFLRARVI